MPIATETLADPKTFPMTVGMVAKNPPLAIPLIMTNATRGPSDSDTGHRTSMLIALNRRETNSVLSGPTLSLPNPQINRPIAEEKLKAATRPAPMLEDNLRELAYNGKKNGGTKRGKVATAPAAKRTANRTSRNNLLRRCQKEIFFIERKRIDRPFNEGTWTNGGALLNEISCRKACAQCNEPNDSKCPGWSEFC